MRVLFLSGLCLAPLGLGQEHEKPTGCTITAADCANFPEFKRTQFRDATGEKHQQTGSVDAACLKRAEDFHHWCGNSAGDAKVAATFNPAEVSQVYHTGACEQGWSQRDAFCYNHIWEKKTWHEAERICREQNSHLVSIHSEAENRFVHQLTHGLSSWIGYTDLDQDTHYKWSDNTKDDFTNWAKNCTGREHEPDCKPEEKAKQWYDWDGGDAGTFVCKRNALVPMALLVNVTAETLVKKAWGLLLPALSAATAAPLNASAGSGGLPLAKTEGIATPETSSRAPPIPKVKIISPLGSVV
jgi:hypothetical protein